MWRKKPIEPEKEDVDKFIEPKYLQLLNEPEAKFLLEHAEKQLKDILDTNLLIVNRTTSLLTLTAGFMIALIGFSIGRWEKSHQWDELLLTGIAGVIYLVYVIFQMGDNVRATSYLTIGSEPEIFFNDRVFNEKNKDYRLIVIYANEIQEYQHRIKTNKKINDQRWKVFHTSIRLVKFIPLMLGAAYLAAILILFFLSWLSAQNHCPC